jgi:hypothetical protein
VTLPRSSEAVKTLKTIWPWAVALALHSLSAWCRLPESLQAASGLGIRYCIIPPLPVSTSSGPLMAWVLLSSVALLSTALCRRPVWWATATAFFLGLCAYFSAKVMAVGHTFSLSIAITELLPSTLFHLAITYHLFRNRGFYHVDPRGGWRTLFRRGGWMFLITLCLGLISLAGLPR